MTLQNACHSKTYGTRKYCQLRYTLGGRLVAVAEIAPVLLTGSELPMKHSTTGPQPTLPIYFCAHSTPLHLHYNPCPPPTSTTRPVPPRQRRTDTNVLAERILPHVSPWWKEGNPCGKFRHKYLHGLSHSHGCRGISSWRVMIDGIVATVPRAAKSSRNGMFSARLLYF